MNNEKKPEDKLREAELLNLEASAFLTGFLGKELSIHRGFVIQAMVAFSEKQKEYHQSLQPVVDVEELKHQFEAACFAIGPLTKERIWKLFIPHLQPASPESDTVEKLKREIQELKELIHYLDQWSEDATMDYPTVAVNVALYEYKQSKTNSDATNNS